ncbi:AIG2 family protein [Colletotrichum tofieldiae]|uniref:gamma-glutamylcyclotransferase n=1 Tax=Colletotrichum tofieldiae TaxID=708197 RepID=A0A166ZFH4_9PEZI|nr:AIG2 family protein [Colletotrichum tofieldiae]
MESSAPAPSPAPSQKPPLKLSTRRSDTLYFAYGSNLYLGQMAQRCPESVFKGKATLPGYKWQINQRGVANVVKSTDGSSVEGLLFSIRPKEERALDLSEGVSKGFYHKYILRLNFEPHAEFSGFKTSQVVRLLNRQASSTDQALDPTLQHGPADSDESEFKAPSIQNTRQPPGRRWENGQNQPARFPQLKALVYISEAYVDDGTIRQEYIARMQNAVSHALRLGVSRSFIDKYITPHLKLSNVTQDVLEQGGDKAQVIGQVGLESSKKLEPPEVDDENDKDKADQPREKKNISYLS